MATGSALLNPAELAQFYEQGYVVRHSLLDERQCARARAHVLDITPARLTAGDIVPFIGSEIVRPAGPKQHMNGVTAL